MEFNLGRLNFAPGDSLLLFTDGVTKALSPTEGQFGEERPIQAATSPAPSAQARIQNIMSALDQHISNREQYDYITLLVVLGPQTS